MDDETTPMGEVRAALRAFNAARDWSRYHNPRNLAMALTVESAELLELYLWSADDGPQPPVPAREPRVAEEAADVLITLLNFCEAAGIDLTRAVEVKLLRNAEKYPADASRGRLEKWSELSKGRSAATADDGSEPRE